MKYYGEKDMATSYQIRTLIECKNEINEYYNKEKFEINNIDEYIDFLFLDMCSKFFEIIPLVKETIKEELETEISYLNIIKQEYKSNELNQYIRNNFRDILNVEQLKEYDLRAYDIIEITLEYIKSNFQVFKENKSIYEYIIKNYAYKVFYDFKDYKNVFEKYEDLLNLLFSVEILKEPISIKTSYLEEPLKFLRKKNSKLYEVVIENIVCTIKEQSFNTSVERVMYTYNAVKNMRELFDKIGDKHWKKFRDEEKRQDIILEEYLQKNGEKYSFEINIKDFVKVYEDNDIGWEIKSLMITHCENNDNMISRFEKIINRTKEKRLIDFAATNFPINDYFTHSVQQELSIMMMFGKLMIHYMLGDDDRLKELMNYCFASVANYIDKFNIDIPNVEDDFNMISYSINNLILELKKSEKDELIIQLCNYNVLHLVIGVFEKIIRELFYEYIKEDKYVPYSKLTLESILNSIEAETLFGQCNIRLFQYYLTSYEHVGNNLRNDICHFNNNIGDICTLDNVLIVMYIFLTLTNELLIKTVSKEA